MTGPLPNVKVLDFSQGHGGPYCTMHLGDAGAEVIKVEPPDGDWARRLGPPWRSYIQLADTKSCRIPNRIRRYR